MCILLYLPFTIHQLHVQLPVCFDNQDYCIEIDILNSLCEFKSFKYKAMYLHTVDNVKFLLHPT